MADQDPIDEFIALPQDQQMSTLQQLAPDKQDALLARVKQRKSTSPAPPAPQQSWWDRVTAPYTEIQKPDPNAPAFSGKEAIKAVGNIGAGGLGVILHPINTLAGIGGMITAPGEMLAGKKFSETVPGQLVQQFKENPLGTIEAGIGQAGAAPILEGEGRIATSPARIIPKMAKGGMDILAGTTPKVAAELGAKTLEENTAAQAKTAAANAKAVQKHLEDTQDALHETRGNELEYQRKVAEAKRQAEIQTQENLKKQIADRDKAIQDRKDAEAKLAAQRAGQEKIAPTQGKLHTAWSNLRAGIETARQAALKVGNEKYNTVNGELNMIEADPLKTRAILADAAETLPGTDMPPLVKAFDERLNGAAKDGMPHGPMTYDELQSFYSKLGNALSKGTLDGETYHAYDVMHDAIGEEMKNVAKRADAAEVAKGNESPDYTGKLKEAQDYWRRMKQAFGKPFGATDAATKALRSAAPDLAEAADQANRIRLIGSFDPDIPAQFNHVSNITQGVESLPEPVSPRQLVQGTKAPAIPPRTPAVPVEPEPVPLPQRATHPDRPIPEVADIKKVGLKDIREAKTAVLRGEKGAPGGKLGHLAGGAGTWHLISSAMYGNPVGMVTGGAVAASPGLFARVLKSPAVVRLLAEPTPADIAAIPPEVRGDLPAIVDAAQKQGVKVHPSILLMARPNAPNQ